MSFRVTEPWSCKAKVPLSVCLWSPAQRGSCLSTVPYPKGRSGHHLVALHLHLRAQGPSQGWGDQHLLPHCLSS